MRVTAEHVSVQGAHGPLLPPTSLSVATGELATVAGDSGHAALALALSGRIRPSTGHVLLDDADAGVLAGRTAIVDAPGITEPDEALLLRDVVAEELGYTGAPAGRRAVQAWLNEYGAADHAGDRIDTVPAPLRISVLVELACHRPGVELLILDRPDRLVGDPDAWWPLAERVAERFAVVLLCAPNTAALLPVRPARIGQTEQPTALPVNPGSIVSDNTGGGDNGSSEQTNDSEDTP